MVEHFIYASCYNVTFVTQDLKSASEGTVAGGSCNTMEFRMIHQGVFSRISRYFPTYIGKDKGFSLPIVVLTIINSIFYSNPNAFFNSFLDL